MNSMNKWIHIDINTQYDFTFDWSFQLCPFGIWYTTLIFPTESGPKWLSSMFLITFLLEKMKVQLLLRLQVMALLTRCWTNLHPSTAWGDFIKANSFAIASSISNSWSGYGIELDQIGTQYLYMDNVVVSNQ